MVFSGDSMEPPIRLLLVYIAKWHPAFSESSLMLHTCDSNITPNFGTQAVVVLAWGE